VDRIAPHRLHVLVEKPFAANVAAARRMIAAMAPTGRRLAINWPAAWSPGLNTAKRLVDQGTIGTLIEVHYYGGNRGPLYHLADKVEVTPEEVAAQKPQSWWYKHAAGGGSLLDYLGYGATLATWFMNGAVPIEVTCVTDEPSGLEVDEHSITVCRYSNGLSKFETRWGTLTDPWTVQPQPKCGFVLIGSDGTISSTDYDDHVTLQTRSRLRQTPVPVDMLPPDRTGPIAYMLDRIANGAPIDGPLDPVVSLTGQRIIDSAMLSAASQRTVKLVA
jgi:glucose-fructose oxidoreductase